ncbi:MAG: ABC transporter permease [Clostridia bacterium]|nr:ABC transporter permease [Clostridia bacterium]
MKTFRQMLRQPVKTFFGIVLLAAATAALIICVGQAVSAYDTEKTIDESFTTVALPTMHYQYDAESVIRVAQMTLPEDIRQWLDETIDAYPAIIKQVSRPGLASAFIPALTPENYTQHIITDDGYEAHSWEPDPAGTPYSCAMLEITLDAYDVQERHYIYRDADGSYKSFYDGAAVYLTGTIIRVIGLQEGFTDPTAYTLTAIIPLPDMESAEALKLTEGERYLIYGMDYYDRDYELRNYLARQLGTDMLPYLYEESLTRLDPRTAMQNKQQAEALGQYTYDVAYYQNGSSRYTISNIMIEYFHSITMNLRDESIQFALEREEQEDGTIVFHQDYRRMLVDESGSWYEVSQEEYAARYHIPTIAHLTGTAEEFLASEDGAIWQEMLDDMAVSNHAFPIVGVDKLGYIADFTRDNARIVAGRDFTEEELGSGARVCILSESLAAANDISVGDVIDARFYQTDDSSPYQQRLENGRGVVNPAAYMYTRTTPFYEEGAAYTVVGLYRQYNPWNSVSDDDNSYAFTPNTIFVPHDAVPVEMAYGEQGLFNTLILKNGAVEEFGRIVAQAGYDGLFAYHDQGYSIVAKSLHDYQAVLRQALLVGVLVYTLILALFLLLFPGSQGKVLATMASLGANAGQQRGYMLLHSIGILAPGTLLGALAGVLLWQSVGEMLMNSVDVVLSLELSIPALCLIALCSFVVSLGMSAILALPMTRRSSLMNRR